MPKPMHKNILLLDPDCPWEYTHNTLEEKPMGGTEATVIRLMRELAKRGHKVVLAQGARGWAAAGPKRLEYKPFRLHRLNHLMEAPDAVILLNTPKLLKKARKAFPEAKLYLWMHCFPGKRRRKMINKYVVGANAHIITVSDTLRQHVYSCLKRYPEYGRHSRTNGRLAPVQTIYNPVEDSLQPDGKAVDPSKLVFFSSPHKGLEQVLEGFKAVRKEFPHLRLCLANPGYWPMPENLPEDAVEDLGSLLHADVIEHVREAFCVFYPQSRFKETFGLVFAEANAVGTPVITHEEGAAREVLTNKDQLVDVRDTRQLVEKLRSWIEEGRPAVELSKRFRLSQVASNWEALLLRRGPQMNQSKQRKVWDSNRHKQAQ